MRRPFAAIAAIALVLTIAGPAAAADPPTFPAGLVCSFGLNVSQGAGGPRHDQVLHNGVIVSAGRGNALVFENAETHATFETPATGATTRTVPGPDGSVTMTMTGANVLFMFPTDTPAGPSTTLYVGRVVVMIDAGSNFTILSSTGRSVDICKALS